MDRIFKICASIALVGAICGIILAICAACGVDDTPEMWALSYVTVGCLAIPVLVGLVLLFIALGAFLDR